MNLAIRKYIDYLFIIKKICLIIIIIAFLSSGILLLYYLNTYSFNTGTVLFKHFYRGNTFGWMIASFLLMILFLLFNLSIRKRSFQLIESEIGISFEAINHFITSEGLKKIVDTKKLLEFSSRVRRVFIISIMILISVIIICFLSVQSKYNKLEDLRYYKAFLHGCLTGQFATFLFTLPGLLIVSIFIINKHIKAINMLYKKSIEKIS